MKTSIRFLRLVLPAVILCVTTACPFDKATGPGKDGTSQVETITFNPDVVILNVGQTLLLTTVLRDKGGQEVRAPMSWTSRNPAVVSVEDTDGAANFIIGVSAGSTWIDASAGGKTAAQLVVVLDETHVADGVVFSSTRDGNAEIYVLRHDGAQNLTQNAATDISPSKQGDRIYFSSDRHGNFEIYSMKLDGTDVKRLTNNSVSDTWPTVTDNGLVAFVREVTPGRPQIYTMSLNGQHVINISNNNFQDANPAWNPNGTRLAFASDRDAKHGPGQYLEIYTMNPDGTDVERLTFNDDGIDYLPAWSPDGSKIAFTSNRKENPKNPSNPACYDQALEIWIMSSDGSSLRNLTNNCRGDAWPSWSQKGDEIVFLSDRGTITDYAWDLWKMPHNGGTASRLTTTGKESSPVWR